MSNEMKITEGGVRLLEKIMRTCPPEPSNGGVEGKVFLRNLAGSIDEPVPYYSIEKRMSPICERSADGYEVYSHIAKLASRCNSHVTEELLFHFFGGNHHAQRIWHNIKNQRGTVKYSDLYEKKLLFSHMIVPVKILERIGNLASGVYENGETSVSIENIAIFSSDKERKIVVGEYYLMHYGFILHKASVQEIDSVTRYNKTCDIFMKACHSIGGKRIDFKKMHYFPRMMRMAVDDGLQDGG